MDAAQLSHKGIPHPLSALFQQLCADRKFRGNRSMPASPRPHLCQQRDQLNRRFGEAVDRLLLMRRIVSFREQAILNKPLQAVSQNVGGNPFIGQIQQLSIMTAIAEHHITDNDQAPAIAKHFQCKVDRAARPLCLARAHKNLCASEKPLAYRLQFSLYWVCLHLASRIKSKGFSCPGFASTAFRYRSMVTVPAPTRISPILLA